MTMAMSTTADSSFEVSGLRTADAGMRRIVQTALNVASSRATVLICGESGTGKEVLARFIHARSPRAAKKFVAVNCAAIPAELLESELFGFERGAFTGALQSKPGKFEIADGGTFLLDEISEMPLHLQAKLLRVIQEGEVERLGARQPIRVNVRLIATTNRRLDDMVRSGQFREDLYYRLNVIPLAIPPLRERMKDIELLARFFAQVSSHMNSRVTVSLDNSAIEKLKSWRWPGNVRELENAIERSILLSKNDRLSADEILIEGFAVESSQSSQSSQSSLLAGGAIAGPGTTIAEMERRLILQTLEHTGQNRSRAAALLGISIRTLRNKLHEYGVASAAEIKSTKQLVLAHHEPDDQGATHHEAEQNDVNQSRSPQRDPKIDNRMEELNG